MTAMPTLPVRESLEIALADLDSEIRSANLRLHQLRAHPSAGPHGAQVGVGAEALSDEVYQMHARRHALHQQLSDLTGMSRLPGMSRPSRGPVGRTYDLKPPAKDAAAVAAEIVRLTLATLPRAAEQHRAPARSPRS